MAVINWAGDQWYTIQLSSSATSEDTAIVTYPYTENNNGWDKNWHRAEPIEWEHSTSEDYGFRIPGKYKTELLDLCKKNKLPEGVEMKNLYEVYMIYAENRKSPVIHHEVGIIASDEEDAKIKSGLMKKIDEEWDADYLTFICKKIGEVKVKEKPKEVKNI